MKLLPCAKIFDQVPRIPDDELHETGPRIHLAELIESNSSADEMDEELEASGQKMGNSSRRRKMGVHAYVN